MVMEMIVVVNCGRGSDCGRSWWGLREAVERQNCCCRRKMKLFTFIAESRRPSSEGSEYHIPLLPRKQCFGRVPSVSRATNRSTSEQGPGT